MLATVMREIAEEIVEYRHRAASEYEAEETLEQEREQKMGLAPYPVPVPFFRIAIDAI